MPELRSEQEERALASSHAVLAEAFAAEYISIVELDLDSGMSKVIKSSLDQEIVGQDWPWYDLIRRYAERRIYVQDREQVLGLTLERMSAAYGIKDAFSLELRCLGGGEGPYDWTRFTATTLSGEGRRLLVTTKVINEDRLVKKTVDLFVYRNVDYFILLNTRNNSYTMFSGGDGDCPVPPSTGDDYEAELARFNKLYVVPEDEGWVTPLMRISSILSALEKEEVCSYTCGCLTDSGEYRRMQMQMMYYDRDAGLVLMTRSDVTQIYQEEMERNRRLSTALREAKHDALTELYNQKATTDLVTRSLASQFRTQAAIFFVDIDNFKLVNDSLGHQKGDELLHYLGRILFRIAGKDGIAGRIGGDEFLLFLPVLGNMSRIEGYAREICAALAQSPDLAETNLPVSCSVGISVYPRDGTDYHTLVHKADQALYSAKRYGKNCHSFYSEEHGSSTTA